MSERYIKLIPTTISHCIRVAKYMREEEKREIEATGESPEQAIIRSFNSSFWVRTGVDKHNQPLGITGLAYLDNKWVSPWLLCTADVLKYWRPFLRTCKKELIEIEEKYPNLINAIDMRYTKSIRWAEWLGFRIDKPHMVNGVPFCTITWERSKNHGSSSNRS